MSVSSPTFSSGEPMTTANLSPDVSVHKNGAGGIPVVAVQYDAAKMRAEEAICRLNSDRGNERLRLRTIRCLRACDRLRSLLMEAAQIQHPDA